VPPRSNPRPRNNLLQSFLHISLLRFFSRRISECVVTPIVRQGTASAVP
jgi:hypothetical protein